MHPLVLPGVLTMIALVLGPKAAARLEARMLAGDVAGAWAVVEAALASGADPADIYVEVLAPALDSVGEGWAQGRLEIEDEHIASSVALRIIGRLGPRFARRGRPRGKIVTATPQGERHGLGVAMLTDILRGEGFEVLDLGPDTPTGSLVAALDRELVGPLVPAIAAVALDPLERDVALLVEVDQRLPQIAIRDRLLL